MAVVLLRWIQYAAGFTLAGGALFALYALPSAGPSSPEALRWPRRLLAGSAAALCLASLVGLLLQTAVVAGSLSAAVEPATLVSVVTEMAMGVSSLARAAASATALVMVLLAGLRRGALSATACLGAIAVASLAWMGHGAATEGAGGLLHLAADLTHLLAAAVWIGALAFFLALAGASWGDETRTGTLLAALAGFSRVGTVVVAALLATGLVNSWFLVGPAGISALLATFYGRLLLVKLVLFAGMVLLAAINRFHLTPALRQALADPAAASAKVRALRHTLVLELGAALTLVAIVAWLGRLAPISAQ